MRVQVRRRAAGLLYRSGIELLQCSDGSRTLQPTSLPSQRVLTPPPRPRQLIAVDLDRVTSTQTFSFRRNGWHPFVATLQQWIERPTLRADDTALHAVQQRFRPRNLAEVVVVGPHPPLPPLDCLPPVRRAAHEIWSLDPERLRLLAHDSGRALPKGQLFGPVPEGFAASQLERLVAVYRSIERHGYRPERFGDSHPTGRFLIDGDQWRFVLRQGHHRAAALRVSGATHLLVEPIAAPMVVNARRLTAFTRRRGGLYDKKVAETLFRSQFDEDGTGRMHELGLTDWLR